MAAAKARQWAPKFWKTIDNPSAPSGKVDMYWVNEAGGDGPQVISLAVPHGDFSTAPLICACVNLLTNPETDMLLKLAAIGEQRALEDLRKRVKAAVDGR